MFNSGEHLGSGYKYLELQLSEGAGTEKRLIAWSRPSTQGRKLKERDGKGGGRRKL